MIFVITGSHPVGFDRLVHIADRAAESAELEGVVQIGASHYIPRHLSWFRFCAEQEFYRRLDAASHVITHGGYTVVEALLRGKPVVAVPRRRDQGEALDDHQVDFVNSLAARNLVDVTETEEALVTILTRKELRRPTAQEIALRRAALRGFLRQSIATFFLTGMREAEPPAIR